jgi:4-hydroxythreonine-4-phosphate dehydrogenase
VTATGPAAGLPIVAITAGDPSGIGPEIAVKAAADPRVREVCVPVIYGVHAAADLAAFPAGVVNAAAGRAAHAAIVEAVADALAGRVQAIATAPINKAAFAAAGIDAPGHTELLASLCGVRDVAMMFWSEPLRVVLATVHLPLSRVSEALTAERLSTVLRLTAEAMPRFGFASPRIAVAGLNPHAGEAGLLGPEEGDVMRPVVEAARAGGLDVTGPIPGDTVFVRATRGEFDVVIAAYHDQGLIPVKLLAFGSAVNVTIGLPIVRTSVDHGTAFDIARQGRADPGSLVQAVALAARLAARAPA